jgi:hypothetical protein
MEKDGCVIGELYLIKIHPEVADTKVSFGIRQTTSHPTRRHSVIIIDRPYGMRDYLVTGPQDDRIRELGYQLYREVAENAKTLGFKWHQFIVSDLVHRNTDRPVT